jgi:hypothetical protein
MQCLASHIGIRPDVHTDDRNTLISSGPHSIPHPSNLTMLSDEYGTGAKQFALGVRA